MKIALITSVIFSLLLPVGLYQAVALDMRTWKSYEQYVDENGEIKSKLVTDNQNYQYKGGIYSQYWEFNGFKSGIFNWLKFTLICFVFIFPTAAISVTYANKVKANAT